MALRAHHRNLDRATLAKEIRQLEKRMQDHARNLEFELAAAARDELFRLRKRAFGVEDLGLAERRDAA